MRFKAAVWTASACVCALLIAFTATAFASAGVADNPDFWSLMRPVIDALLGGDYWYAAAAAVVLAVAAWRRYGPTWGQSGAAGAIAVAVGSFAATFGAALADGALPSWDLAWLALKLAVSAGGSYSLIRAIVAPLLDRLPSWLAEPLRWLLSRPGAVEAAEQAGRDAVAQAPSKGVSGVVGDPRDIP